MQTVRQTTCRMLAASLLLAGGAATAWGEPSTLYVDAHNPTPPDPYEGFTNNWANAATNIQEAVNAAQAGDTILVRAGTYRLPADAVDFDSALNVVYLPIPLTIRGVDGPEVTLIDGEGQYRGIAVGHNVDDPPTVFEGLTVTNGFAPHGGGVVNGGGTTKYFDCTFVDNRATGDGGALANRGLGFSRNNVVMTNCRVLNNSAGNHGGAEWKRSGALTVIGSVFEGNTAGSGGGALWIRGTDASPTDGVVLFENTIFRGNVASGDGGAFFFRQISSGDKVVFRNCLMVGNQGGEGGAVYVTSHNNQTLELYNCTISMNTGDSHSARRGAFRFDGGESTFVAYNSIIHGNVHADVGNIPVGFDVTFAHNCATLNRPSDVPDFEADGNFTDDPRFADPAAGNFRLRRDSPCINNGLNQDDWMQDATDLDGNPRIDRVHNQVDMGAFEFQFAGTTILVH